MRIPKMISRELKVFRYSAPGIPVLKLEASAVDARQWDNDKMTKMVEDFIESRVLKKMSS